MSRIPPTTVPVPMCSIGVGVYGEFINEADVRSIAMASVVEVKQNSVAAVASSLNDAATGYILISQAMASEPDGDKADWCVKTADRVASVLACFSHAEGGEDPIEAAGMVLRGPPEKYIEVDRLPINPRDDVRQSTVLLGFVARLSLGKLINGRWDVGADQRTMKSFLYTKSFSATASSLGEHRHLREMALASHLLSTSPSISGTVCRTLPIPASNRSELASTALPIPTPVLTASELRSSLSQLENRVRTREQYTSSAGRSYVLNSLSPWGMPRNSKGDDK